jgi:C-methyltransferase C-terminal domain/Putative zinc binding domain/Methyltransferase domain
MSKKNSQCRLCKSANMVSLLDLGDQCFTGIFPKSEHDKVPSGRLELAKCTHCDLVQLGHSFDSSLLYGNNYGYRSGLNSSMVRHLNSIVHGIVKRVDLAQGDLVIDIGSNDSTTLRAYPDRGLDFLGIDPTGLKFKRYYPSDVRLVPEFFSAAAVRSAVGSKKAKVITAIAMFYDLEAPGEFMKEIAAVLAKDGVWVFEQSYLDSMLRTNSYDTICHEHLEYYGLKQIRRMTEEAGFKILDVVFNEANGGSFRVTTSHKDSPYSENTALVQSILEKEDREDLYSLHTYKKFSARVAEHKKTVHQFFARAKAEYARVLGYGASTKGNVLLQYCGVGPGNMACIADVNEDKFGSFTPGTLIPIVSEAAAHQMKPDYFFVLPWHFRAGILQREKPFREAGGKLVFPLPELEIV